VTYGSAVPHDVVLQIVGWEEENRRRVDVVD